MNAVGHDHMLALANDTKPAFSNALTCIQMVDAGELGHELERNFDLPHFRFPNSFFHCLQILPNRVPNILKRFLFCLPL